MPRRAINRTPGRDVKSRNKLLSDARTRISGYRQKLTVAGKDESSFSYRWVLDTTDNGHRIHRMRQLGYELCSAEDIDEVGESWVMRSAGNTEGSVVRVPAGDSDKRYLYLMKCPIEIYDANKAAVHEGIDSLEAEMYRQRNPDDDDMEYGRGKLVHAGGTSGM